jgi:hypothetical protein
MDSSAIFDSVFQRSKEQSDMTMEHQNDEPADFRSLYPAMSAEQLAEAEQNFDLYIDDAVQMYDGIRKDPIAYRKFRKAVADLTLAREIENLEQERRSRIDDNTDQESRPFSGPSPV